MSKANIPPDEAVDGEAMSPLDVKKLSGSSSILVVLAAVVMGVAAWPKAFEEHVRGGLVVTLLVILTLASWVAVTWIQYG
ncbi:hypothetical protein [Massilia sp. LjRoot122]|uniref:hypothetical protein n=1 Tax=Massilia sp. LjRoot122 TaxID=3342257 RepID=UPI003ECE86FA